MKKIYIWCHDQPDFEQKRKEAVMSDDIIYKTTGDIKYIQYKKFLEYNINHCYTLKGINFRNKENYKILENTLGFKNTVRPIQQHTDLSKRVDSYQEIGIADGVFTDKPNIALATVNADCILFLLYEPVKKVIASVHSGWRGTLQKILLKTIKNMQKEYDIDIKELICCISPSIRKCHFEVDEDVKNLFYENFNYTGRINDIIEKQDKYHIDTVLINKILLEEIGVKNSNVIDANLCSMCNHDILYSHRLEKEDSGRNTAIIML